MLHGKKIFSRKIKKRFIVPGKRCPYNEIRIIKNRVNGFAVLPAEYASGSFFRGMSADTGSCIKRRG